MKNTAQLTGRLQAKFSVCNEKGAALLITLLIVSILTGLAVDFAYEVYIGTSSLSNWSNAQKASLVAKSGQTLASNLLKELPPTTQSEVILPIERSFGENTTLTVKLEDEEAKFNINSIIYSDGRTNPDLLTSLQNLFKSLNIKPDVAEYIADWIDSDSTGGYEDNAKNAPLWSLEELKFIKGIDNKTFYTIIPFLTVCEDKQKCKININTAKLPVLLTLTGGDESVAKKIIYHREIIPFKDKQSMVGSSDTDISRIGSTLPDTVIFNSTYFRVTATATVDEITRVIESVTDTSMKINYWRES